MSITPEEAFNALKTLYPSVSKIEKCGQTLYEVKTGEFVGIDWGSLTEWPPAPQEQYREPTQDDVGIKVEVRDTDAEAWMTRVLTTVLPAKFPYRFVCETEYSEVAVRFHKHARIRIDEPATPDWLPDGWRVLGEDEVIEDGDKFYIPEIDSMFHANSSLGDKFFRWRESSDLPTNVVFIRRIEVKD